MRSLSAHTRSVFWGEKCRRPKIQLIITGKDPNLLGVSQKTVEEFAYIYAGAHPLAALIHHTGSLGVFNCAKEPYTGDVLTL